jgi:hypothetical protein
MLENEIPSQYIAENLKFYLKLVDSSSFRKSLSIENDSAHPSINKVNTFTPLDPTLIVTPIVLLVMSGIVIFHKFKLCHQDKNLENIHYSHCRNCCFFSDNIYLKCVVNPSVVFKKAAINCRDYQPLEHSK